MNKNLNFSQVLFTSIFVLLVLAIFSFLVPEFENKGLIFIVLGGLSAFAGGTLSSWVKRKTD